MRMLLAVTLLTGAVLAGSCMTYCGKFAGHHWCDTTVKKEQGKMWPVAIVLIAVVLFYWFSFCLTVIAWLKALSHLCFGNFIRASIYFCIGSGLLFWWLDKNIDFEVWMRGSAAIVCLGALGTFMRFYNRHQRAAQAATPSETTPFEPTPVVINIVLNTGSHADRRAVSR